MAKFPWKRLAIGLLASIVLACVAAFFAFRMLEAKIAQRFIAPQFHQALPQETAPQADYDFAYTTLDGEVRHLSQLKGKTVFVNFWGTWCLQCIAEMPTIQKLYNNFRSDPAIAFIIASRLDPPGRIRWYAREGHYDLPFSIVRDSDIPPSLRFHQYPATFIFAKDGTLVEKQIGGADWSTPSVVQSIRKIEQQ